MDIIISDIFKALDLLFFAGLTAICWKFARDSARKNGGFIKTLGKAFLICFGIAFFSGVYLGTPSCLGYDTYDGTCIEYDENDFEPTLEVRVASFSYFMVLLFIPSAIGVYSASRDIAKKDNL